MIYNPQLSKARSDWKNSDITEAQLTYIKNLCDELNLSRQSGFEKATKLVGRCITEFETLNRGEASLVINYFKEMKGEDGNFHPKER